MHKQMILSKIYNVKKILLHKPAALRGRGGDLSAVLRHKIKHENE